MVKTWQLFPLLCAVIAAANPLTHPQQSKDQFHAIKKYRNPSKFSKLSVVGERSLPKTRNELVSIDAVSTSRDSTARRKADGNDNDNGMLLVNSVMFFFYAVLGSALPFVPLYYSYLGVPEEQIGWLGAITPAVTFLVSPLWGALADSSGLDKQIMFGAFFISTAIRSGLVRVSRSQNLFVAISTLVGLSAAISAPVKPLLDAAVMGLLKDKSGFGKSRLYGQLGFGFGSFLVGPFLGRQESIGSIFYMQALLAVPTSILMLMFIKTTAKAQVQRMKEKDEKDRASAIMSRRTSSSVKPTDLRSALEHVGKNYRILVFFTFVFMLGISSGIIENFAYVRLKEMGGYDGNVLGICRLVSSIAGVPMFWAAGPIVKAIGVNGVLLTSMIAYVLRFTVYGNISNTWQALPAEILRGVTFALFTTGSTYYVYLASPSMLIATMLSLLSGTYNGLGQTVGSLVGGALSKKFGIQATFRLCACVDVVFSLIFASYLLRERAIKPEDEEKRRP